MSHFFLRAFHLLLLMGLVLFVSHEWFAAKRAFIVARR